VDGAGFLAVPLFEGFFGREHQDRRQPCDERVEQCGQDRAIGAAARTVSGVAIEAVLADIEEEGAEILVHEGQDCGGVAVVGVGFERGAEVRVERGEAGEDVALEFRHGFDRDGFVGV
jgi:hypothetical protein